MSNYRSGQPSASHSQKSYRSVPAGGAYLLSSIILGVCILIAGLNVGGAIKALNKTMTEKEFSSSFSSPDKLTVKTPAERKYLTQKEAADYLNITESEITNAIADGDITEYIITSDGYSISVSALDDYFENTAYRIQMKKNAAESDE